MSEGLAQIGIVLAATVVGLPLFFFALLAALDRFERSLSGAPRPAQPAVDTAAVNTAAVETGPDAEVLPLPLPAPAATSAAAV